MKPKFKIDKSEVIHIAGNWISNGHWALDKEALPNSVEIQKACQPLQYLPEGSYRDGYVKPRTNDTPPNINQVIPKLINYVSILANGLAIVDRTGSIGAYQFTGTKPATDNAPAEEFTLLIDPKYVPLLNLGFPMASGPLNAVAIVAQESVVAVVMPRRK